jgi:YbbR domain-containing protein
VILPGFIRRNWRLKVGCFLIAFVTWVGIVYAGNPPGTKVIAVPVPQSSIPAQFVLVHPVQDILVRVGGDQNTLQSLDRSAISVTVDWAKVTHTGIYSIPVSVVSEAANIELITPPASVQVDVDAFKSKSVPVTIVITNPPPVGYQSGVELASPSSVVIAGPERELNGIQARVTIDLSAQKANFQAEVNVLAYDSKGVRLNDVSPLPQNVSVNIAITADVTKRIVAVLPRTEGTVAPGHSFAGVIYSPQSIQVTGPLNLLNGLDSVTTSPIFLTGVFGNFTETVSVVLPAGVTSQTTKITVTIEIGSLPTPPPTPTPTPTPSPTPGPT